MDKHVGPLITLLWTGVRLPPPPPITRGFNMKMTESNLRSVIRKALLENINIPEEPPFKDSGNQITADWNRWFFEELNKFPWLYMPTQKKWQENGTMYNFSKSADNRAVMLYGSFGMRWKKYKHNRIMLSVVPKEGYGQKPGIYINFELKSGGVRNLYLQSIADLYFPFKNYRSSSNPNFEEEHAMSAKEILEELSHVTEEITECFRVLLPAGNKSVKTMPPSVFYTKVWPKIEKYASEQGKEAAKRIMSYGK